MSKRSGSEKSSAEASLHFEAFFFGSIRIIGERNELIAQVHTRMLETVGEHAQRAQRDVSAPLPQEVAGGAL
jgi:hypothetical protein